MAFWWGVLDTVPSWNQLATVRQEHVKLRPIDGARSRARLDDVSDGMTLTKPSDKVAEGDLNTW